MPLTSPPRRARSIRVWARTLAYGALLSASGSIALVLLVQQAQQHAPPNGLGMLCICALIGYTAWQGLRTRWTTPR